MNFYLEFRDLIINNNLNCHNKGHLKSKTKMKSEDCKAQVIPPSHNREDAHAVPACGVAESTALHTKLWADHIYCIRTEIPSVCRL